MCEFHQKHGEGKKLYLYKLDEYLPGIDIGTSGYTEPVHMVDMRFKHVLSCALAYTD